MTDPRRRKDNRCAVCRKPIVMRPRYGLNPAFYEVDPFCSADCARRWHGTSVDVKAEGATKS